jgi:hypothetical protein
MLNGSLLTIVGIRLSTIIKMQLIKGQKNLTFSFHTRPSRMHSLNNN